MSIKVTAKDDHTEIALSGDIIIQEADALKDALLEAIQTNIAFDLSQTTYIDTSCLQLIWVAAVELKEKNLSCYITVISELACGIFNLSGVRELFEKNGLCTQDSVQVVGNE